MRHTSTFMISFKVVLALLVGGAGCSSKTKDAPPAAEIKPDPRLDSFGGFDTKSWPPAATTLADAITEVEARIGPGTKQPDGIVAWHAQNPKGDCAYIHLSEVAGKLEASKGKLRPGHPDFADCIK